MRSLKGVSFRRPAWVGLPVVLAVLIGAVFGFGVQELVRAEAQNPVANFNEGAGFIQAVIEGDKTDDFESVMQKVKEALQNSENSTRQQQAAGWKIYRTDVAQQGGNVLYFMVIDPAVRDANYTISTILSEGYPSGGEAQSLYGMFSGSFAGGMARINMELVNDFSN